MGGVGETPPDGAGQNAALVLRDPGPFRPVLMAAELLAVAVGGDHADRLGDWPGEDMVQVGFGGGADEHTASGWFQEADPGLAGGDWPQGLACTGRAVSQRGQGGPGTP